MNITIIGSGSSYTPELVLNLDKIETEKINLTLYDIDNERLDIIYNFTKRILKEEKNSKINIKKTLNLKEAIYEAEYIISQFRVGGNKTRAKDIEFAKSLNLIAQETTGLVGFFKALRTIPEVKKIIDTIKQLNINPYVINFTNPSGLISQSIFNMGYKKTIGICNIPILMTTAIKDLIKKENLQFKYIGLNHLSWILDIKYNGKSILDSLLNNKKLTEYDVFSVFNFDIFKYINAIPSPYLKYFYLTEKIKKESKGKNRGKEVEEIEKELFKLYKTTNQIPQILKKRGGALYSKKAIKLLNALISNEQKEVIINYLNNKTINFLKDDSIIETNYIITKNYIKNRNTNIKIPTHIKTLILSIKNYELLTIKGILNKDIKYLYEAMLINPLIGDQLDKFKVIEDYIKKEGYI